MRDPLSGPDPGGCDSTHFTGRSGQPLARAAGSAPAAVNAARAAAKARRFLNGVPPSVVGAARSSVAVYYTHLTLPSNALK